MLTVSSRAPRLKGAFKLTNGPPVARQVVHVVGKSPFLSQPIQPTYTSRRLSQTKVTVSHTNCAAEPVGIHVSNTQNHADTVFADDGVVLSQHHSSKPVAPSTPAAVTTGADAVTGTARNEATSW